jgi:hypothetical protein
MNMNVVLIWSDEHEAWLLPDAKGYTTFRDKAGRWWMDDARKCIDHYGPEKRLFFELASFSPRRSLEEDKEMRRKIRDDRES